MPGFVPCYEWVGNLPAIRRAVTGLVLDAGALIAVERGDRHMHAKLKVASAVGAHVRTHEMVVGQVWRDARGRQARLAKLLATIEVVPVDALLGRAAGELCGATSADDPIDDAVALICQPGDVVLSSDRAQMASLVAETGTAAEVVAV